MAAHLLCSYEWRRAEAIRDMVKLKPGSLSTSQCREMVPATWIARLRQRRLDRQLIKGR